MLGFSQRKLFLILVIFMTIFIMYLIRDMPMNDLFKTVENFNKDEMVTQDTTAAVNCTCNENFTDPRFLENLFKAKIKPKFNGKTIFFLETRLEGNVTFSLTPRQACSVESAAVTNPNHEVFLIYMRKVGYFNESKMPIIDALLSYKNIHINHANIQDYAENTPLEAWMQEGLLFKSNYVVTHTSDIVRFLSLWRYTGTYVDIDMILQKPLDSLGNNYACIQFDGYINSAFMNLDMNGRHIAEKFFERTIKSFSTTTWIDNGPGQLTNIMRELCNTTDPWKMTRENCKGFSVLPTPNCFEIPFNEYIKFFNETYNEEVFKRTANSNVIHFWNYMSAGEKLLTSSNASYIKLAEKYCPMVLKAAGEFF